MAESLAKISSMIESARDLTIEAAASANTKLTDVSTAMRPAEISKLLNSRVERDVLNGMKCVLLTISRGGDGLPFFADVVKNVTTSNQKIKNLVLVFLTRYAELEPDIALLSINSIQKLLNDKNTLNRARSIKALAGIRISTIIPILTLSMKRTIADPSPIVRAATAVAIGKVYDKNDSSSKQLFEFLTRLLSDSDITVVASAIKAYYKISPDLAKHSKRWDPIHGNFRRFCAILPEIDQWSQTFLIQILTSYSRVFLPIPRLTDGEQVVVMPQDYNVPFDYEIKFDPDLKLYLDSVSKLIHSDSRSVIISVAKSVYALAPPKTFKTFKINEALLRIATTSADSQISYCALQFISEICLKDKTIFEGYFKRFYLFPDESLAISSCKLQILASLASETNIKFILEELKYYAVNSSDDLVSAEAIKAIGRCSKISSGWNQVILSWSLKQIKTASGVQLNEILTVVRYLLQQKLTGDISTQRSDIIQTVYKLSLLLNGEDTNLRSEAKASALWIVGEMTTATENSIGPDVLRLSIKTFAQEVEVVRYQILILAAKVYSYELDTLYRHNKEDEIYEKLQHNVIYKMYQHVLHLAKYDVSYDTRDKARMLTVLLGNNKTELASLFLQVPKAIPLVSTLERKSTFTLIVEQYLSVSDWCDPVSDPSIRKEISIQEISLNISFNKTENGLPKNENAISSQLYHRDFKTPEVNKSEPYQLQSLDDFFGSEEEDESEESSSEEEQSEEAEESEAEESESDESEEESEGEEVGLLDSNAL